MGGEVIKFLCRTEKLKLMYEVRGRVMWTRTHQCGLTGSKVAIFQATKAYGGGGGREVTSRIILNHVSARREWPNLRLRPFVFPCFWRDSPTLPQGARATSFIKFLDHTQRRTKVGRTPLDEWSVRCRDLYLDNTQHTQQTDIHVPGGIRTHDLSRRATADLCCRPRGD